MLKRHCFASLLSAKDSEHVEQPPPSHRRLGAGLEARRENAVSKKDLMIPALFVVRQAVKASFRVGDPPFWRCSSEPERDGICNLLSGAIRRRGSINRNVRL